MKLMLTKIRAAALVAVATIFVLALLISSVKAQNGGNSSVPAPQETPPPPSAPRPVNLPKPVEQTLRNGLRVIVIENHETPLVAAQLMIKNGGEVDPPDLSGVADMTASLLTKGTKTRTAPQIAREVESLGGQLNSSAGWDASRATVNVIASKTPQAMAILADVVRNPVFKDEEIDRLRQQYQDNLSVGMNNPGQLASWVAARVVFGSAAYGHPISGTPESLARIKRDDIIAIHQKYYRPDNAILVIGGDIKAADAFQIAERTFGDWAKPSTPTPAPQSSAATENPATGAQRVVVVDMPGAGQAAVLFARRGIARTDPEYYTGIVANSVLTGYSGRLNEEIRIKRGLSYGAGSSLQVRREAGPFIASAQTKNQTGADVASLLVTELTRLSNEPVAETELTPRKATLIGGFGRSLETTEGLVGQIASLALYGLKLDEINGYITSVQAVTAPQVQKFAGARLGVKDADIVIVGDAKDFIEPLRKQFPNVEVIRRDDLDLNSATLRKSSASSAK